MLMEKFTKEEILKALNQLHPDKAPGLDRFPTSFFQKCWPILGSKMTEALETTRSSRRFLREINNTFIVLIPKKDKALYLDEFRPISLCNTIYKVLTKTLANRLKMTLPKIIGEEQTGFVPRRSIFDGVIIAQEAIHSIQKNKQPSMIIKLHIKKAYDKVDWRFLSKCMKGFGFCKSWINLLFYYICTPKFSILINGNPCGFFESSKGIRQGYPLSPFFFIIMVEALGRKLCNLQRSSSIRGVEVTSLVHPITHQQFADDTILFGKGCRGEALQMKRLLSIYAKASGQVVNKEKSQILSFHVKTRVQNQILSLLGFNEGRLPCTYLGIPVDKSLRSSSAWKPIEEKIDRRMESWKSKWLSWAG